MRLIAGYCHAPTLSYRFICRGLKYTKVNPTGTWNILSIIQISWVAKKKNEKWNNILLKSEYLHQPFWREGNWGRKHLLPRGDNYRTRGPTFGYILHSSMVRLWTTSWHGWTSRQQFSTFLGLLFVKKMKRSTKKKSTKRKGGQVEENTCLTTKWKPKCTSQEIRTPQPFDVRPD